MAKPKKEEKDSKIDIWFKRISSSERAKEDLLDECEENKKLYNGNIVGYENTGFSKNKIVDVNLLYVDLKQSVSSLYAKNPKIFFTPEVPEAEFSAKIYELCVNNLWKKLKMKQLMRDSVKATKLSAIAVFKTYFYFSSDNTKDEWNDRIFNDEVRTDRIPIDEIYWDCEVDNIEKSPWIAHEVEMPVTEISKKFNLSEDEKNKIKVTSESDLEDEDGVVDEEFKYGCFYEIEDRRNRKIFCIIKGINKKFDEKDLPFSYDTMYDFLIYNNIPDTIEVHSDVYFWKKQLKEIGIYRTMVANHAKKGTAKYKAMGLDLNENQITQLKSSQDSTIVQLSAGQDVSPIQHATIDPIILQAEAMARNDIQLISKNAPRQSSGEKTATEVKAVEAASMEVSSEALSLLEDVMASIATKWAKLIKQNYTTERVISLSNIPEAEFMGLKHSLNNENEVLTGTSRRAYLKFDNTNLKEEIKAGIKAGSTLPDNEQTRIKNLMGFASFLASIPGAAAALDIEEVVREAEDVFGVRNMNLLKKKDDPASESKLLNSEVFVSAKMTEPHDFHIKIHEQESNGNYQNTLHIQMHKEFKSQMEKMQKAQKESSGLGINSFNQMAPLFNQMSGQSFMGANLPPQTPPIPAAPMGVIPGGKR